MNLLGAKLYDPVTAVDASTASLLAMTAFDITNLRLGVIVPAHGFVRVRIMCALEGATTFPSVLLGVLVGVVVKGRVSPMQVLGNTAVATARLGLLADFVISGLTPGATNFDAAYGVEVTVAATNIKYGGPDDTITDNAWGAFVFEIWDPQPIPTVAAGASGGLLISGSNLGTTTFGALTVTGTATISDGLVINRSSSNTSAVTFTGNGTGNGFVVKSGTGATGDGMQVTSQSTNGKGLNLTGTGSGDGLLSTGGAGSGSGVTFSGGAGTGSGMSLVGGATAGDALTANGTAGHGFNIVGAGSLAHGILCTGAPATVGSVAGNGFKALGGAGAVSGNGAGAGFAAIGGGTVTVSGAAGMAITGTGNISGATFDSGSSGTSGNGITATSHATGTNGAGLALFGAGSGPGLGSLGGSSGGHGIHGAAGSAAGVGIKAEGTGSGGGFNAAGGINGDGFTAVGGSSTGRGIVVTTTSGDGIVVTPNTGHGVNITANGASKHGIFATGGTSGTSDGMKVAAGTGGVDFRGNINSLTIQKNTALAAFPFFLVSSTDHVTGKTGATVTATRRLDSGTFAACANAVTEVANGWYTIDLAATDLNGNTVALLFTAAGADPRALTIVTQV